MVGRTDGKRVYEGIVIDVDIDEVSLPNGAHATLEIIRHPGAAAVVPLHPDRTVTLIRQYRYAAGGFIHEVPAGKLEPAETPESCADREIEEETGLRAGSLTNLGFIFTTPGFTDEKIHLYAATDLTETSQALEPDEVLEVVRLPLDEALAMAARGEITDSKSLCALFRVHQELEAGRIKA
jgi:ADP-ribose pyrophosphatase